MTITKAAIAELFYTGKLREVEGEYIPCDYAVGCFRLFFLWLSCLLPLVILVISLGQQVIRQPESLSRFYLHLRSLHSGLSIVIIGLMFGALGLTLGLCLIALPKLKLSLKFLKEAQYQRQHKRYRYGLLLTQNYLAIRCFSYGQDKKMVQSSHSIKAFTKEPIIIARTEIIDVFLCDERLDKNQRTQYLMMHFFNAEGYIQHLKLPTRHLDIRPQILYEKLKAWLKP